MRNRNSVALTLLLVLAVSAAGAETIITEIIDATGDGGNPLDNPEGIAVDGSGNVYVTGYASDNAFKVVIPLFSDGFESSDTSAWSNTVP